MRLCIAFTHSTFVLLHKWMFLFLQSGVTALIYALREESSSEAAEVLIKAGAGLSYQETVMTSV